MSPPHDANSIIDTNLPVTVLYSHSKRKAFRGGGNNKLNWARKDLATSPSRKRWRTQVSPPMYRPHEHEHDTSSHHGPVAWKPPSSSSPRLLRSARFSWPNPGHSASPANPPPGETTTIRSGRSKATGRKATYPPTPRKTDCVVTYRLRIGDTV